MATVTALVLIVSFLPLSWSVYVQPSYPPCPSGTICTSSDYCTPKNRASSRSDKVILINCHNGGYEGLCCIVRRHGSAPRYRREENTEGPTATTSTEQVYAPSDNVEVLAEPVQPEPADYPQSDGPDYGSMTHAELMEHHFGSFYQDVGREGMDGPPPMAPQHTPTQYLQQPATAAPGNMPGGSPPIKPPQLNEPTVMGKPPIQQETYEAAGLKGRSSDGEYDSVPSAGPSDTAVPVASAPSYGEKPKESTPAARRRPAKPRVPARKPSRRTKVPSSTPQGPVYNRKSSPSRQKPMQESTGSSGKVKGKKSRRREGDRNMKQETPRTSDELRGRMTDKTVSGNGRQYGNRKDKSDNAKLPSRRSQMHQQDDQEEKRQGSSGRMRKTKTSRVNRRKGDSQSSSSREESRSQYSQRSGKRPRGGNKEAQNRGKGQSTPQYADSSRKSQLDRMGQPQARTEQPRPVYTRPTQINEGQRGQPSAKDPSEPSRSYQRGPSPNYQSGPSPTYQSGPSPSYQSGPSSNYQGGFSPNPYTMSYPTQQQQQYQPYQSYLASSSMQPNQAYYQQPVPQSPPSYSAQGISAQPTRPTLATYQNRPDFSKLPYILRQRQGSSLAGVTLGSQQSYYSPGSSPQRKQQRKRSPRYRQRRRAMFL